MIMFSPLTWMSSRICSTGGRREVERNSVPRSQVCWITVIIMVMVRMEGMTMLVMIMFIVVIITPGAVSAASGAPVVASLPPVPQLRRLRADKLLRSSSRVCWSPTLTCIGLLDWSEGVRRGARHACVLHLFFIGGCLYYTLFTSCTDLSQVGIYLFQFFVLVASLTSPSNEDISFTETELSRF